MYLRTTKRKNKNGTATEYYQLAHNERHPETRKTVARIIHNFGRADELNLDELVRLCRSIARVCDIKINDPGKKNKSKPVPSETPDPSVSSQKPTYEELERRVNCLEKTVSGLRESGEKFRTFFENANDQIVYIDTNGIVVEVNAATEDIFGWKRKEVLNKHYCNLGLFKEEDANFFMSTFGHTIKEGNPLPIMEIEAFRKNGTPVSVEINSKLIAKDGNVIGILNIIRNITNRKKAERALQESEEMARALLNATTDAVLLIDHDGVILDLNEAYAEQFQRSIDEMIGLCLWNIVPGKIANNKDITEQVFKTGKSIRFEQEYQGMWQDHVVYPVMDSTGKVSRVAVFSHDITKLKQAEEALRRHRDNLEVLVNKRTLNLGEANTALKVLLKRMEEDKVDLENKMLLNVKELVIPFMEELNNSHLNDRQKAITEIIEYNLNTIISPFVNELSSRYLSLTPTEIRIANIIKQGKSTKDIVNILKMSPRTIDNHRYNIRKKLGINKKKASLGTYLLSIK